MDETQDKVQKIFRLEYRVVNVKFQDGMEVQVEMSEFDLDDAYQRAILERLTSDELDRMERVGFLDAEDFPMRSIEVIDEE